MGSSFVNCELPRSWKLIITPLISPTLKTEELQRAVRAGTEAFHLNPALWPSRQPWERSPGAPEPQFPHQGRRSRPVCGASTGQEALINSDGSALFQSHFIADHSHVLVTEHTQCGGLSLVPSRRRQPSPALLKEFRSPHPHPYCQLSHPHCP